MLFFFFFLFFLFKKSMYSHSLNECILSPGIICGIGICTMLRTPTAHYYMYINKKAFSPFSVGLFSFLSTLCIHPTPHHNTPLTLILYYIIHLFFAGKTCYPDIFIQETDCGSTADILFWTEK